MPYDVNFFTYSGMRVPILERVDREEAQQKVKDMNKRARRRGQPVYKLGKNRWEHGEEEDNGFIGDMHGILSVKRVARKRRGR